MAPRHPWGLRGRAFRRRMRPVSSPGSAPTRSTTGVSARHARTASLDAASRPVLGRDLRRLERPDPDQRPFAALLPRGRLQGRAVPDQPDPRPGAGAQGLSRYRRDFGAGRVRGHRGAGQSRGRGDGVLRRQGGQGGGHVHRRLRRDRRRGARDADPHHADRARRRHQAVRPELPRPVQHAHRPYADLQLVSGGGADPGRAARHGHAIGRVRHASAWR